MTPAGAGRSSISSWIMLHPLATYLVLAFTIAWSFWVPLALLYHGGSDVESLLSSPLVIALQTLGVTAPMIAAVAVTGVTGGKAGVRNLLNGLRLWRVGACWYLAACLLVPVLAVIGVGVRAALGVDPAVPEGSALADMLGEIGWIGVALTFPLQLLPLCFGSPLLEEPGWRGFAFARLQDRMPAAWAAFLVGAIWGLWHLPLFIALHENLPVVATLIVMHGFLLAWLYANTSSLALVVLGHASQAVANNSLSLPDQGIVQIGVTIAVCTAILIFFRLDDLRPRRSTAQRTRSTAQPAVAPS
jgi:uncharacterized protein